MDPHDVWKSMLKVFEDQTGVNVKDQFNAQVNDIKIFEQKSSRETIDKLIHDEGSKFENENKRMFVATLTLLSPVFKALLSNFNLTDEQVTNKDLQDVWNNLLKIFEAQADLADDVPQLNAQVKDFKICEHKSSGETIDKCIYDEGSKCMKEMKRMFAATLPLSSPVFQNLLSTLNPTHEQVMNMELHDECRSIQVSKTKALHQQYQQLGFLKDAEYNPN